MIRLNLSRGPKVLDLGHGVTVTVLPLTSALMMAARTALVRQEGKVEPIHLIQSVGRLAIIDWTGVVGEDGAPAPVTGETVTALLDIYQFADAFEQLYIGPALILAEEKNASAPSPNGTSAGASPTAQPAPSPARSALIN
ncbi:hypothetical protein V5F40_06695 [Xanthobacter sp. DSM 14520]|uniref:hypothetical protein n=1 Tax=Xanthobacter autotrophicus (strain ATCC BAA-1158 / Py2) TaxID=78245 RepID=UPI0037276D1A